MPHQPASIKARALQWLAQREHSPQELRGKLLRLVARQRAAGGEASGDPDGLVPAAVDGQPAEPEAEIDALLQWLAERGYLSSERFVESRINARQARFGNLRIRQELQQHGLKLDEGKRQALRASEEHRAREVWQRRYGQAASDTAQRLQQLRFLAGRGFSMDVVRRVVPRVAGSAGHDDDAGEPDDSWP